MTLFDNLPIKNTAKPFLKWAGGKTQLIKQIKEQLPQTIYNQPFTYIEPFVGSGAVLFWMLGQFPNMERAVINDINKDLTDCYLTIKGDVEKLTSILYGWQEEYYGLALDEKQKREYYYDKRTLFNNRSSDRTTQGALFIFLNRTCFNGLFRVNGKNEFNVPIGSYKKPQICNAENLMAVSAVLQKIEILNGDFSGTIKYANNNTFFYFDPPYKPLSETSSFNAYAKGGFDDAEQIRLKEYCDHIDASGHQWMLSNSDVKGENPVNDFFDELYSNYHIARVKAKRAINSNGGNRGEINELLITNNH